MKKRVLKQGMAVTLATVLTATTLAPMGNGVVHAEDAVDAVEASAVKTTGDVTYQQQGSEYTFGNEFIKRTFQISADKKLTTAKILNYRTDGDAATEFVPQAGSQEFIIRTMANGTAGQSGVVAPTQKLAKTGWKAEDDGYASGENPNGPASKMIDGDEATYYHSQYGEPGTNPTDEKQKYPHNVFIDFGKAEKFQSLRYLQRLHNNNPTPGGRVNEFKIYVGNSKEAVANSTTPALVGNFKKDQRDTYVNFDQEQEAQWVRIEFVSIHTPPSGYSEHVASCAEFDFYKDKAVLPSATDTKEQIESGDLRVKEGFPQFTQDGANNTLTFEFEPVTNRGVQYTIKEIITMKDGDSFMRKRLEISVPDAQADQAKIDYIDLENMSVADADLKKDEFWTISDTMDKNPDMANQKGDYLELGQPYYMGAMYWGCEFPETENKILNKRAFIRYHYGKSLKSDDKFSYNKGNERGKLTTWDAVVGAARSKDYSVCQSDFYEYIETIATETNFRQQYNSWYDNMKNITDASIQKSFFEVEKGFTQKGVEPLDSYVVDDGWIDYQNSFWGFNNKFPNELYNSSLQVQNMGANFGLWLGPRGGYSTQTDIANYIERNGFGSVNRQSGNDINVSDARYLTKLTDDIFCKYQDRFDINYWKLDGMLLEPSTQPSEYYVTGKPLYTISETYERWTDVFEDMRANRAGKDLWLNLTSFTNPSPWHLQWVNSVWMQNSGDTGYTNKFGATTEQQMLTYRDNCYYNFLNDRQWQLPNKYFYNHDPVYGVSATDCPSYPGQKGDIISYTTDEMRNHLYMLGTRGTAFWEYYYSPSMFDDEKWQVNAEAATWIEDNFDILQKSKMFGGRPAEGDVYGYSCWNGNEGIVSIRNPKDVEQTYELTYDRLIGVNEKLQPVYGKVILGDQKWQTDEAMTYGKKVSYTLKPQEVLIIQYGAKDEAAPQILSVEGEGKKVEVEFDETIQAPTKENFKLAGFNVEQVALNADRRTATLTLDKEVKDGQTVDVAVNGVKDVPGNVVKANKANDIYANGVVTGVKDLKGLDGTKQFVTDQKRSIDGHGGFSVTGKIKTTAKGVDVASQDGAYKVAIDNDGYLTFTFKDMTISSKNEVRTVDKSAGNTAGYTSEIKGIIADGTEHQFTAVKEINGMIKIYLDGKVVASKYQEQGKNPELTKAATTFANGLAGDVAYITVVDRALAYDEVAAFVDKADANVVLATNNPKAKVTSWDATDDTPARLNNDKPAANINDGSKDMNNYFELTDTNANVSQAKNHSRYIQIDLGAEYELNRVHMWRYWHQSRQYGPTVLALSTDETFTENEVVYNSDTTGEVHHMGKGTDQIYAESAQGKELWKSETPVKARYIRLYVNGRTNNQGTSDHIVELEAYGTKAGTSIVYPDQVMESVAITSAAPSELKIGETYQATAEVYPTGAAVELAWTSSNDAVAVVDQNGLVTAKKAGTAEITVTATQKTEKETIKKSASVVVKVGKEEAPQPEQTQKVEDIFVDVNATDWYRDNAQFVFDNKIMTGMDATHFGPTGTLARAQLAVIMYRMEGSPKVEYKEQFKDVPAGQWFSDAVIWAYNNKIITGYTDSGLFKPANNISRQEMATMMYRYANYKGHDTAGQADLSKFPDCGNVSGYAEAPMKWCVDAGIISGDGTTGQLMPLGTTNRAVCATIITRFMQKY